LPANVACAVNPALTYARVEQDGDTYYLAHSNVAAAPAKGKEGKAAPKVNDALATLRRLRGHEHGEATITGTLTGSEMLGWRYRGPFDELAAWRETGAEHRVVAWDDVTAEEGTGIVHMAPGCGREDYQVGKREGLAVLAPVDESGVYHEGYGFLTGQSTAEVARAIFDSLREKGYFYQTESYKHVYPHCWRCKTELIFRLVDEWFISMGNLDAPGDNLRKRLVRITQEVTWIPGFGLERELDWLRNMEDWMISKKRYWGLALPIWRCDACERFEIIGSKEELRERAVAGWEEFEGHTPHRPWVDAVKIACSECGQLCSRVLDVGNPWLDAGIVSFSTMRYATDRDYWRQWFPADFITESFPGQFRNWFYSLLVMAAALEDTEPFRTVLGFATLFDEFGKEMHKSAGNSIPFDEAAEIVGADTMRWLFVNQTPEQNLRFPRIPSVEDAKKARAAGLAPRLSDLWMQSRAPLDKLWNVYSFFVTYANIDGFNPATRRLAVTKRTDLDRWLLSEVQDTTRRVTAALEAFDPQAGAFALAELIEDLSNWYVRRSRRRFWKAEEDADKVGAYLTLYECLVTLTKLLAPFTPFIAESMYQNLVCEVDRDAPESVHLCDWPKARASLTFPALRDDTALVMRVVALGRAAREKAQLRVRQPLSTLYVRVTSDAEAEALARLADQLREELNVKRVELLPDGSDMLHYTVQPRMSVLGPKLGKLLPKTLATLRSGDMRAAARDLRDHGRIALRVDGQEVTLTPDDVEVEASAREGYVAAEDRGYVVALDTSLSPELVAEGLSRDLTHLLQEARKHAGLDIQDHIEADLWTDRALATMLVPHHAYLADETLSRRLEVHTGAPDGTARDGVYEEAIPAEKLGGHALTLRLRKR
ncbi:MAG TPA: class I tRNA ligase family protein, partial [Ktedonobacterales bacterium]